MSVVTTVAKVLEDLSLSVESFIDREMTPGVNKNPNILAARAVGMAIDNAAVAYDYPGTLRLTEDKVEATVRKQLAELRSMVGVLQSKQSTELLSLHARVQQFIYALPLAEWQPKLTGTQPDYAYALVDRELMLRFEGLFRCAASLRPQRPELSLGKLVFYPNGSKDDNLTFSLLTKELAFPESALTNCQLVKGTLSILYNPGKGRANLKALYHVQFLTFPLSLGEIKLIYPETVVAGVLMQHFTSATFRLDRKNFEPAKLIEREIVVKPTHGWKIATPPQIHSRGPVEEVQKEQYNETQVLVKLSLPADQEEAECCVKFDETQNEMKEQSHQETLKLQWGEAFSFEAPSFHADFTSFNGQKSELTDPDQKNPYLKILKTPKGYQMVASPPVD